MSVLGYGKLQVHRLRGGRDGLADASKIACRCVSGIPVPSSWTRIVGPGRSGAKRGPSGDGVRQWGSASVAGLEGPMGTKDKGGRSTKKVAARDLKQKRLDKKAKKDALKGKPSRTV